jgi:hypothetical protein
MLTNWKNVEISAEHICMAYSWPIKLEYIEHAVRSVQILLHNPLFKKDVFSTAV